MSKISFDKRNLNLFIKYKDLEALYLQWVDPQRSSSMKHINPYILWLQTNTCGFHNLHRFAKLVYIVVELLLVCMTTWRARSCYDACTKQKAPPCCSVHMQNHRPDLRVEVGLVKTTQHINTYASHCTGFEPSQRC